MSRVYPETQSPRELLVAVAGSLSLRVLYWASGDPSATSGVARAPFLLLHGIASTAEVWAPVAERLAASGHRVYAADFRGHGQSDKPDGGYDLATYASDVAKLIEGLGLERPVLVGHSLGACVILEAFARRPEMGGLVRGVVMVEGALVDASVQFATLEACLARVALPPVTGTPAPRLEAYLRHSNPDWPDSRLRSTMAGLEVLPDGTVEWWLTPARREALARALWDQHSAGLLPAVDVPALWIVADTGEESWTEAKRRAALPIAALPGAAMPGATVDWLTADHDVHAHRPDDVAASILAWSDTAQIR